MLFDQENTDVFYLYQVYWDEFKRLEEAMDDLEQYENDFDEEYRMQSHLRRLRRRIYVQSSITARAHQKYHDAMANLFTQDHQ